MVQEQTFIISLPSDMYLHKLKKLLTASLAATLLTLLLSISIGAAIKGSNVASHQGTLAVAKPTPTRPSSFNQSEGKLKGVVELGASGFNFFVIRVNNKQGWSLERSEFGYSLAAAGMATEEDIYLQLKNYIGKILNAGVRGPDIHFVVSSGANQSPEIQKIVKVLETKHKYVVKVVTPREEALFAFKLLIPNEEQKSAFVVDIGSGNTKFAWLDDKGGIVTPEADGAKYLEKARKHEDVAADIKKLLAALPAALRKKCYIIGGVPSELASEVLAKKYNIAAKDVVKNRKPEDRYTKLNPPDSYTPSGDKQRAGLNIYKTIASFTGCEDFIFDWDANFTIGYLLSLN